MLCTTDTSRKFEEALNRVWSKLADPGAWLSYDEQMVKSTARANFFIMRFNPKKPIKHGELSNLLHFEISHR